MKIQICSDLWLFKVDSAIGSKMSGKGVLSLGLSKLAALPDVRFAFLLAILPAAVCVWIEVVCVGIAV